MSLGPSVVLASTKPPAIALVFAVSPRAPVVLHAMDFIASILYATVLLPSMLDSLQFINDC
jgi:hypothetical protein